MTSDFTVTKNQELGLYEGVFTINLPPLTIVRHKADRNDFKYDIRRAVEELVGEMVEKQLDD